MHDALALLAALAGCAHTPPSLPVPGSTAALAAERAVEGTLASRVVVDDADLVLLYASEQRGSLDTCGCPREPRGGIPRMQAYIEASVAANPETPWLLVNAGWFLDDMVGLDGQLRADVRVANRWLLRGLAQQGSWTALNAGTCDLPGLIEAAAETPGLPLVSANVRAVDPTLPVIQPWILVQAGALRVGITGITAPGASLLPAPGYEVLDPLPAGRAVLAEHAGEADVAVLLAFQAIDPARALAQRERAVDVVVDAFHHSEITPPFRVGDAVWVKSSHQTQSLGELRLWIEDGRVIRALDRKIELDPDIPGKAELVETLRRAQEEIDRSARELFGP